jgi:hypothetical protein
MGTNSKIFYEKSPNVFHGISCHFDGYFSGVGSILYKHYQDLSKIEKLIKLGEISSLDKECDVAPRYQYTGYYNRDEQRHFGYTFAYHRDRGDELMPPMIENSLESLITNSYGYVYVWRENKWFTYDHDEQKWMLLKDTLISLAKENEKDTNYYTDIPRTIELTFSYDDYRTNIFRGFLILKKDGLPYCKGDYIKLKATEDNKKYALLVQVNEVVEHDGIKEDHQLIVLSNPPKDFAWYMPMTYI